MYKYLNTRAQAISEYVAGEQPKPREQIIKLNTNESPYPPSPRALLAGKEACGENMRLYPPPKFDALREVIARRHGVSVDNVFCGNGSDEVLGFCFMAFFGDHPVRYNDITYAFYKTYAEIFGMQSDVIPLNDDFTVPYQKFFGAKGGVILPNPNAPTGIALPTSAIEEIVQNCPECAVVIDEAYVEFGTQTAIPLIHKYDNLLVIRTLSKSQALAGLRVGYAVGSVELINGLFKIKDCFNSYPLDFTAQACAAAALADDAYYTAQNARVVATRERTKGELLRLGFQVTDSKTNFVFVRHPKLDGAEAMQQLRARNILVRNFRTQRIKDHLRISMGTDAQMDILIQAFEEILQKV